MDDYFSFEFPVTYNPNADSNLINKFINDFCSEEQEKISCLQTILGYCITGEIREQRSFIFSGLGANGKSILILLLKTLFGDCYTMSPKDLWIKSGIRSTGGPLPHLAELENKRISLCDEIDSDSTLDEGQINYITGSSVIKGRGLYNNPLEFPNYIKLLLFCNPPLPKCSDRDATWRRPVLFNCDTTFVENTSQIIDPIKHKLKDKNLGEELCTPENLSAFLNWLIIGSKRYYQLGLYIPPCIINSIQQYKDDNDPIKEFFDIHYEQSKNCKDRISKPDTYKKYQTWFAENADNNMTQLSRRDFHASFSKKAIKIVPHRGTENYIGIKEKFIISNSQSSTLNLLANM